MRRVLFLFICLCAAWPAFHAAAQADADYTIRNLRPPRFADDGREIVVEFDVVNNGGPTTRTASVLLVNTATSQEIVRDNITPIAPGATQTFIISFAADVLPVDGPRSLRLTVGLGDVEPFGSATSSDNQATFRVPPAPTPPPPPAPLPARPTLPTLPSLDIDLNNPLSLIGLGAVLSAGIILLALLIMLLRLLFRRPPVFGSEAPPYAGAATLDPNTTAGRRQSWQQIAQNDAPPIGPAVEGAAHIRKLLLGMDGVRLSNWRITGVRLSQYDQYGRVTRSQMIAPRGSVRRLNRIIRRGGDLNQEQLVKRLRPIARGLAGRFRRRINPRGAFLPVALDLRFQGVHGEVRIVFELFGASEGQWQFIDRWDPEMTVTERVIHEVFTYSLHGLRPGETFKAFGPRLTDDIVAVLAAMIAAEDGDQDTEQVKAKPEE